MVSYLILNTAYTAFYDRLLELRPENKNNKAITKTMWKIKCVDHLS